MMNFRGWRAGSAETWLAERHTFCSSSLNRMAGSRQMFLIQGPAGPREREAKHHAVLPGLCNQNSEGTTASPERGGEAGGRQWRRYPEALTLGTRTVLSKCPGASGMGYLLIPGSITTHLHPGIQRKLSFTRKRAGRGLLAGTISQGEVRTLRVLGIS